MTGRLSWGSLLLWVAPFIALAAGERDQSRPDQPARVAIVGAAFSSDEELVQVGPLGRIRVDSAWVSLRNLRFRRGCGSSAPAAQVRGPIVMELISARASGLPERLDVPSGRYCRVEADFRQGRGRADGAAELRDRSVVVVGRRDDGVRFTIRTRRAGALRIWAREPEGFSLRSGEVRLFLAVDLAGWMDGLDLANAIVNEGPTGRRIEIDESSNPELLARFEANLIAAFRLYRDEDGDGKLGPEERVYGRELASAKP